MNMTIMTYSKVNINKRSAITGILKEGLKLGKRYKNYNTTSSESKSIVGFVKTVGEEFLYK
jgi:hypothetical protein